MAQWDSIGGCIPENTGIDTYDIIPPVGQVWLITYFQKGTYNTVWLVDVVNGGILNIDTMSDNPNIRLFISDKLYIRTTNMSGSNRWIIWNGVQFK